MMTRMRACQRCDDVAKLAGVISRSPYKPAYRIYECPGCGFVDWVEQASAGQIEQRCA